jgi:hypothetical protein
MKKINIAGILIIFTLFFVVLTGLNISIFAILSFTNQSDLIMSMAIETVYNTAYVLKNEIYKIMEKEIFTQRLTDVIEKNIEDIKKLSTEDKLTENELNKRNLEIKMDIERQLRSGEIAITAAEIIKLPSNVTKEIIPNTIKDFIVNKNLMIIRFKIFSTNDRAAISFWGYEQKDKLLLSIPSKTVEELLQKNNEDIIKEINPSLYL